jgi:hypothetical protein
MSHRIARMLLVPLLISSCITDPPTPDLLVYLVNHDSVAATVHADGAARSVAPCGLYSQGFFGTGEHDLQVDTSSGTRSTALHSVRGSYVTNWYVIGTGGDMTVATQSDVNAVVAECRATGTGASPT